MSTSTGYEGLKCGSPHQHTPLHLAAEQRLVDAVQVLIEKGADINVKDSVEVGE